RRGRRGGARTRPPPPHAGPRCPRSADSRARPRRPPAPPGAGPASDPPGCPWTGPRCRRGGRARWRRTAAASPRGSPATPGTVTPRPAPGRSVDLAHLLRRQRGDHRVVLGDDAELGRAARRPEVVEELDVGLVVVGPLLGDVVLV